MHVSATDLRGKYFLSTSIPYMLHGLIINCMYLFIAFIFQLEHFSWEQDHEIWVSSFRNVSTMFQQAQGKIIGLHTQIKNDSNLKSEEFKCSCNLSPRRTLHIVWTSQHNHRASQNQSLSDIHLQVCSSNQGHREMAYKELQSKNGRLEVIGSDAKSIRLCAHQL